MWFFGFILPILLVTLGLTATKLASVIADPGELTLTTKVYNDKLDEESPVPYNADGTTFTCFPTQQDQMSSNYECPNDSTNNYELCCPVNSEVDDFMDLSFVHGEAIKIEWGEGDIRDGEEISNTRQLSKWLLNTTDQLEASRYVGQKK